jgi:hypothetical protein
VGRHEAAGQPPLTDRQVRQQLAVERSSVDARRVLNEVTGFFDGPASSAVGAGVDAAAVSAGGRYEFNPAQVEDQLRQCDDLVNGLREEDMWHAHAIANTTPPAPDTVASGPQAAAVAALGERLAQRINNQIAFVENWQDQLRATRQSYLDQEGNTVASWMELSGGLFT